MVYRCGDLPPPVDPSQLALRARAGRRPCGTKRVGSWGPAAGGPLV